jgi:hypothetical protein
MDKGRRKRRRRNPNKKTTKEKNDTMNPLPPHRYPQSRAT